MTRSQRAVAFCLTILSLGCVRGHGQAALLMEEPYGFFGLLNPAGHSAVYFERICAETPTKLRRCAPGEAGAVVTRYQGIGGYDWLAMPLLPYLYSVDKPEQVPLRVDRKTVIALRNKYREAHLLGLGKDVPEGGAYMRGWNQLVGTAYERRMYAYRFATTEEQDDALIARMNAEANSSHYSLALWNCADFSGAILDFYFPHSFHRSLFPDAGITTPRQITYKLAQYAHKHPGTDLAVFQIGQIPGYRGPSRKNKSLAESFITRGYVIPLALVSPYLAAAVFADYLAFGRYPLNVGPAQVLAPGDVVPLTLPQTESARR